MSAKEKEEATRGATLALRIIEPMIPEGAKGYFYQTPEGWLLDYGVDSELINQLTDEVLDKNGGWLLDYGDGVEVDLPPLSKEEIFALINCEMSLPFALQGDGPENETLGILIPGLPERRAE